MTKLERIITDHLGDFMQMPAEELQARLDELTPDLLTDARLGSADISDHMAAMYDATAKDYVNNPHNQGVIEELVAFMNMIHGGGRILDIGCGPGRDALFMACPDSEFRASLMQRVKNGKRVIDTFNINEISDKTFDVIGIDISLEMLAYAQQRLCILAKEGKFIFSVPLFLWDDMHKLVIGQAIGREFFDGVWSCTGLFTHSLYIDPGILALVAFWIKKDAIFFTSYTNGTAEGEERHKFLVSSTRHIKYFSQPDPKEIARMADKAGLSLIAETYSDKKRPNAPVKKCLFVSQFYRKR